MENQQAQSQRWLQVSVLVAIAVVVAFGLGLMDGPQPDPVPEAPAPAANTPRTVTTTRVAPERGPDPVPVEEEALEPDDDIPRARQPRKGEAWDLLRVPLACAVDPPVVGPPVVGEATPVTWPGKDHEPVADGLDYPAIPMRVTVDKGEATATTFLPVRVSEDTPTRHVARLVLPGFAPTDFSFTSTGPDEPATCDAPIKLAAAAQGVTGVVSHADGSPAVGAIVAGCGVRVVTGSEGDYFLLPRSEEPCRLRARHAPGSSAESEAVEVDLLSSGDQVLDFVVEVPEQPDPGVEIFRTEEGEVWGRPSRSGPWERKIPQGVRILQVGEVPANELSDEELLLAMVRLDEAVLIHRVFETEDGQRVQMNTSITEL